MAERYSGYRFSDQLAIALACLAGIMAIILFFAEKTRWSIVLLLSAMVMLAIYPALHFFRKTRTRVLILALFFFATIVFGDNVWPKKTEAAGAAPPAPSAVGQSQSPVQVPAPSVPAPTVPAVYPRSRAEADRIARRIGVAYQSQHPHAGREELQTAVNRELARKGYRFAIELPRLAAPAPNPPALIGGGQNIRLILNGIRLADTSPNNGMTAIRTGSRSPVTITSGGIDGFSSGIKTGNDSPVGLTDTPITAPKPADPPAVNYAPGGFAISGGTVTNPTVNNLGPPPPPSPVVTWGVTSVDSRPDSYRVKLWMLVTNPMPDPGFIATCDKPCWVMTQPAAMGTSSGSGGNLNGNPSVVFGKLDMPNPIQDGTRLEWWITSKDGTPIKILDVKPAHIRLQ